MKRIRGILEREKKERDKEEAEKKKEETKDAGEKKDEAADDADKTEKEETPLEAALRTSKEVLEGLTKIEERLRQGPGGKGIGPSTDTVTRRIRQASGSLGSSWDRPNATQKLQLDRARTLLDEVIEELNTFHDESVKALSERMNGLDLDWIRPTESIESVDSE